MSVGRFLQQAAAGNAGADATYVEDVFSTTLYTGNGSSQSVESDVALGKDNVTLFKYNDNSTTLATLTNHEEGDIVVIWDTNSSSGITFTVNSNSTTALHSQYTWVSHGYYQNLHKYTITASDVSAGNINVTASSGTTWGGSVFLIKGATGVSLQATTTDANGNSVAASSFTTSSYGILLISDRDADATSPASTNSSIVGSVNSDPTYFSIHAWLMDSGAAATVTGVQGSSNYYQAYAVIEVEGVSNDGGLLWLKERTNARYHYLYDTVRGGLKSLSSNANIGQGNFDSSKVSALNGKGFSVGNGVETNGNTYDYAAWTFKKQAGFFDIVTYTGDGNGSTAINHDLGSVPGMMIIKRTNTSGDWAVYHRAMASNPVGYKMQLNGTGARNYSTTYFPTLPTDSVFYPGSDADVNGSGNTYIAYLFAHDAQDFGEDSDEAIIKCGTIAANSSETLGFEPQWLLTKKYDGTAGWTLVDNMRRFEVDGSNYVQANTTSSEATNGLWKINSTGFSLGGGSGNYIYVAIRRPNKPAEELVATDLFKPVAQNFAPGIVDAGFPIDFVLHKQRGSSNDNRAIDRLRGGPKTLKTNSMAAEGTESYFKLDNMDGLELHSLTVDAWIFWMWRRAPGFFDVVAYTGSGGSTNTINHNLGVVPEMMWVKRRDGSDVWWVYHKDMTGTPHNAYMRLDSTAAVVTNNDAGFGNTAPTATQFTVGGFPAGSGQAHIAYLFASVDGISKVGTYTGDGTTDGSKVIDCGMPSGPRLVLAKKTSSTGHWFLFDSERGIVTNGNDYQLRLNSSDAETTSQDKIDIVTNGFCVKDNAGSSDGKLNHNNQTYIFYAIA